MSSDLTLDEIEQRLGSVGASGHDELRLGLAEILLRKKEEAVAARNEGLAKHIWCLEQTLAAQSQYLDAFQLLMEHEFFGAWNTFEQVEMALGFLSPHFQGSFGRYCLDFIQKKVSAWQGLFPYKVFFSPEILEGKKTCSICGKLVSIREPCGHEVGEIYGGQQCHRVVSEVTFLGLAMVDKPLQKYTVPFIVDPKTGKSVDHYDYTLLEYATKRIRSPFQKWSYERTTRRHPHAKFRHVGRNEPCPCKSGKKYKKCCLQESGVLMPHIEFVFEDPIPGHLMTGIEFSY